MIKWKDEYLVGIEIIDEQHKELFKIAGSVYDIIKNDFCIDKYDKIVSVIGELQQYTIFHFKTEEDYMEKIGYKKLFTQKIEHGKFIEKVMNVNLKNIDSNQDTYLLEILSFVVNWIASHILESDKQIVAGLI